VAIEDEEAHSEEAASAANEAQFPTDDTTEDEDWVNEDSKDVVYSVPSNQVIGTLGLLIDVCSSLIDDLLD
jgi:hypothetical protein